MQTNWIPNTPTKRKVIYYRDSLIRHTPRAYQEVFFAEESSTMDILLKDEDDDIPLENYKVSKIP